MRMFSLTAALLLMTTTAFAQHRGHVPSHAPRQTTTRYTDNLGHPQGYSQSRGGNTKFYTNQGYPQGRAKTQGNTTRFYSNQGYPQGRTKTTGKP